MKKLGAVDQSEVDLGNVGDIVYNITTDGVHPQSGDWLYDAQSAISSESITRTLTRKAGLGWPTGVTAPALCVDIVSMHDQTTTNELYLVHLLHDNGTLQISKLVQVNAS